MEFVYVRLAIKNKHSWQLNVHSVFIRGGLISHRLILHGSQASTESASSANVSASLLIKIVRFFGNLETKMYHLASNRNAPSSVNDAMMVFIKIMFYNTLELNEGEINFIWDLFTGDAILRGRSFRGWGQDSH